MDRMPRLLGASAATIAAVLLISSPRAASRQPPDLQALVRNVAQLTPAEISNVQRGQPVARVLDTERAEVAISGAVHIRAPRERILDRYRDVSLLAKSEMVLQVGRLGVPPRAEDLRELVFEPYDLDALRECEPGDCAVRLPAAAMGRFEGIDWRAPAWRTQAAALWRLILAEYAADYRARGDRALAEYHNKAQPLRLQDQFGILYKESAVVTPFAREILRYLQEYPRAASPGVQDVLYWSKDNFGVRPVLSVTHLSIHTPAPADTKRAAVVATKQIYATHYFDAALGITLAVDDGAGGSYVIVINRARTRSLTSRFRGFVRSTVQGRSRDGMEKILRMMKESLERPR
jgi:hypothetical protein